MLISSYHQLNEETGFSYNINNSLTKQLFVRYIDKLRRDETEKARLDSSATKIQAFYRGYVTRRELRLNSQRISKFQLKFRDWLKKKKERKEEEKDTELEKELSSRKVRTRVAALYFTFEFRNILLVDLLDSCS